MKNNLSGILESEQKAIKTAFLSYYISMYNSASKEIGFPDTPVTVEEIYDFIQDLKHEAAIWHLQTLSSTVELCQYL
jgi:hypothetical protein